MGERSQIDGVWVTYYHDMGSHIDRVFTVEVEALRAAVDEYRSVTFIRFGQSLDEAIAERKAATSSETEGEE